MSFDGVQRVIVGGGHFVEHGGRLVQEVVIHNEQIVRIVEKAFTLNEYGLPNNIPVGHRIPPTLIGRAQNGIVLINSEHESRAWYESREGVQQELDRTLDVAKDVALSVGCGLSGDSMGAIEYGYSAAQKFFDPYVNTAKDWWETVGTLMTTPDRDK